MMIKAGKSSLPYIGRQEMLKTKEEFENREVN